MQTIKQAQYGIRAIEDGPRDGDIVHPQGALDTAVLIIVIEAAISTSNPPRIYGPGLTPDPKGRNAKWDITVKATEFEFTGFICLSRETADFFDEPEYLPCRFWVEYHDEKEANPITVMWKVLPCEYTGNK